MGACAGVGARQSVLFYMSSLNSLLNHISFDEKLSRELLEAYFEKREGAEEQIPDTIKNFIAQFLEPEDIEVCKLILKEDLAAMLASPGKVLK